MPNHADSDGAAVARGLQISSSLVENPSSSETAVDSAPPANLEPFPAERRREIRYATEDPAELEVLFSGQPQFYGTVLDVSRSGLRIAVPNRINRGEQVKIKLQRNVIFGEVRYCRAVQGRFHIGLKIHDLVRPPGRADEHIADESLSLYTVGKGLSVEEVIEVREHLSRCEICRMHLGAKAAQLNPHHMPTRREPPRPEPLK